jgi:hypothetical protein
MRFESFPATAAATIHLAPKAAPTVGIRARLGVPADLPGIRRFPSRVEWARPSRVVFATSGRRPPVRVPRVTGR